MPSEPDNIRAARALSALESRAIGREQAEIVRGWTHDIVSAIDQQTALLRACRRVLHDIGHRAPPLKRDEAADVLLDLEMHLGPPNMPEYPAGRDITPPRGGWRRWATYAVCYTMRRGTLEYHAILYVDQYDRETDRPCGDSVLIPIAQPGRPRIEDVATLRVLSLLATETRVFRESQLPTMA